MKFEKAYQIFKQQNASYCQILNYVLLSQIWFDEETGT